MELGNLRAALAPGLRSRSLASGLRGTTPRIVALERVVESEDIREIETGVGGLADEEPQVHEGEHDISDVGRRAYAPVLEHQTRHDAIALEREVAARFGELAPGDM